MAFVGNDPKRVGKAMAKGTGSERRNGSPGRSAPRGRKAKKSTQDPVPARLRDAREALHRDLLDWFRRVGRDLPWRQGSDPYRVWISEIMLQQTQVERVKDFFRRFIERFPDVRQLAAAPEADLLRAWEGLGYYRRARQLHAAAQRIVADHDARIPDSMAALRSLPGIGRYTAGAIASIAFGLPEPIVEANSRRVLARLAGHEAPVGGSTGDEPVWRIATELLPHRAPATWNQALMDLGAGVCVPRVPLCTRCPVAAHCVAHATGRVATIPVTAPRREAVDRDETAVVVRRGTMVLVVRRGAGEWWEGLWDFPRLPARRLLQPLRCGRRRVVGKCAYSVTHHRVTVTITTCTAARSGPRSDRAEWVSWTRLGERAMAAPGRRIMAVVKAATVRGAVPSARAGRRVAGG
jgi:A/G-specific adenine glycosylase